MKRLLSLLIVMLLLVTSGMPAYAVDYNLSVSANRGYSLYIDAENNDTPDYTDSNSGNIDVPPVDQYNATGLNSNVVIAVKGENNDNKDGIVAGFNLAYTDGDSNRMGTSAQWYVYTEQSQPPRDNDNNKWYTKNYRTNEPEKWVSATEIKSIHEPENWPLISGGKWIWTENYSTKVGGLDHPIYLRNKILGIIEIDDQSLTTPEDTPLDISIPYEDSYGNEWDVNLGDPTNGSVVYNGDGSITYTPDANFNGNDSFTVEVEDSGGVVDTATIYIEVTPVDDDPKANDDNVVTDEDTSVNISVLDNDDDPDDNGITIDSNTSPSNGSLTLSGDIFNYTPNLNYNGTDSFTYKINGGDEATVTITINPVKDTPIANDDAADATESISVDIDVLDNDEAFDGEGKTVTSVTDPANGTVINHGTHVEYTSDANFNGVDTFTYMLNGEVQATVTVTVDGIDDLPVAVNDEGITDEDTPITVDVMANDMDTDGGPMNIIDYSNGTNGTVTMVSNQLVYTPNLNYNGTDSFTYELNGGSIATVNITVNAVNDLPVANDDDVIIDEDTSINIPVLDNDIDVDGDNISIESNTLPSNGSVTLSGDVFSYTPDLNYNGTDSFTYKINGGDEATVTITINPVKDMPIALPDAVNATEGVSRNIDVLVNDSAFDGEGKAVTSVTDPANGTVVNHGTHVEYTSDADFNGVDTFTYMLNGEVQATVTVTVDGIDDLPIAVNDEGITDEDTPITVDVMANDMDTDGGPMNIIDYSNGTNGTVAMVSNQLVYTPDLNYNGTDSFTYELNGGSIATVSITINAVNDLPVANDDAEETNEDESVNIYVLLNDSDVEEDPIIIDSYSEPQHGILLMEEDYFRYTPNENYNGSDAFTYTLVGGSTATVTIDVIPVDDLSEAVDDETSMTENTSKEIFVLANDREYDGEGMLVTAITNPSNGSVTNNGISVTYTPNPNFTGTDTFNYTLNDESEAQVTVTVNAESTGGGGGGGGTTTSTPTINAVSDAFEMVQGESLEIDTSELLANDEDYESFESVQNPNNGTVRLSGSTVTFTPDPDFTGRTYFYYTIADGADEDSAIVVVDVEAGLIIEEETTPLGPGNPDAFIVIEPEITPLGIIDFSMPYIMGYPDVTFRPEREVTRSEMAAIFARILDLDLSNPGEPTYTDVSPEDWDYKYIQAVTRVGLFNGYEGNMFKPHRPVTHAEIASAFSAYWDLRGIEVDSEGDYYSDISGHWAEEMINRLYNAGISVSYTDGTFKPDRFTTRTEIVIMVNRSLDRAEEFKEVSSFSDVMQSHWGYGAIEAANGYQEPESVRLTE